MPQRERRRGLTLIEILIVVAILGLFMTALLYFVFPSDERRCELEAKRLAAYLTTAGAESAMRDGAVRVAFDIGASKGEREITKIGADVTRDLWEQDRKSQPHEVQSPVKIDAVDTPAVPDMKAGIGYVLFRNGKCAQGAVVVLGIGEVFYSVVVPATGGEIRVEPGRSGKPTAGTDSKRPSRKGNNRNAKGTTSTPPDYSSGSLGSAPKYTPPPPSRSRSSSSSGSSKDKQPSPPNSGKSDAIEDDFPSVGSGKSSDVPMPSVPDVNPADLKSPEPPDSPDPDNNSVCTPGQSQCINASTEQVCTNDTWITRACGPGQTCSGSRCTASNMGTPSVEPTNHLLTSVTVTKPAKIDNLLGGVINNALSSGQINWLIHRKAGSNGTDTLGFWLVQGQLKENVENKEYELKSDVPTYALRENDTCPYDNGAGGILATGRCFETERVNSTIGLYIPNADAEEGACQYFFIELLFVTIELDYNNDREMKMEGTLSLRSARELEIDGVSIKDKLEELDIPMDGDLTGDGDSDSWVISFTGRTESAVFTDDPANHDDSPPNCID